MNVLLAVIGVTVTIAVGVSATYLTIRFRYPGRLTFVVEAYIGLFDSIVRNLSDLDVVYKKEPVNQNLVLMKGAVGSSGVSTIPWPVRFFPNSRTAPFSAASDPVKSPKPSVVREPSTASLAS